MNRALRDHLESRKEALQETLCSVVREELAKYGKKLEAKPAKGRGESRKSLCFAKMPNRPIALR